MIGNAKRREHEELTQEADNEAPCHSIGDVINRLKFALAYHGGILEEEKEPGLPLETREVEGALRQAIRFLQALGGLIIYAETSVCMTAWVFTLGPLSSAL